MARVVKTEQQKKKSKIKTVLIVLAVILVIVGGGFAVYKLVFDKEEKVKQEIKEILIE